MSSTSGAPTGAANVAIDDATPDTLGLDANTYGPLIIQTENGAKEWLQLDLLHAVPLEEITKVEIFNCRHDVSAETLGTLDRAYLEFYSHDRLLKTVRHDYTDATKRVAEWKHLGGRQQLV